MKLLESRLRQIINQEVRRMLSETRHVLRVEGPERPDAHGRRRAGGRLKVSYDYDGGCIAVGVGGGAGDTDGDVELVQKVLNSYDVDRAELERVLSEIGIEDVEAEGEIISVDEFIDSF